MITPNDNRYQTLHHSVLGFDYIIFQLQASQEAHIALSSTHTNLNTGGYWIDLGAFANSKTVIFKGIGNDSKEVLAHETSGVLDPNTMAWYWIGWKGGLIEVRK